MGLKMNIHTPAAAGSSNVMDTNLDSRSVMELMAEKDKVEAELKALGEVLESHGVNMNTSLTTFDGYPRDDIDIAQIRITRARIIHLRNDWKDLMDRIEKGLHAHFANANGTEASNIASDSQALPRTASDTGANATEPVQEIRPFAKVNSIVSGSPADQAGLQAGDEVVRFGDINWLNHDKLSQVARFVQTHEGRKIQVTVNRGGVEDGKEVVRLDLTPTSNWGGRGLLGCHLLPI